MDLITDEYSRELGKRNIARYNARVKRMSYNFSPEVLPTFQVKAEHILEINPPRSHEEFMRRITDERANAENNLRTVAFMNSQKDVEIEQLKETLKNPNVNMADAEAIYQQLEEISISKLQSNDPQLTRKSELIHSTLSNEKRDRANIIRNYGVGLREINDKMEASNRMQREAIEKFGSIERAVDAMNLKMHERAQQELEQQAERREIPEGKGREVERGEEEVEALPEDDIEVVQGGGGGSDINRIFTDADAHVGHALSTKNDMVKWIKYVKSKNSSLIKLPEEYEIIELNKLLSNHRSAIRVNELPAIIAHIRGQV